jgi:prevent-host-death family protein
MARTVSKTRFKARALEYFREVERTREELIITDRGRPVVKLVPFSGERGSALLSLRDSVVRYDDPTEPVGTGDWEVLE